MTIANLPIFPTTPFSSFLPIPPTGTFPNPTPFGMPMRPYHTAPGFPAFQQNVPFMPWQNPMAWQNPMTWPNPMFAPQAFGTPNPVMPMNPGFPPVPNPYAYAAQIPPTYGYPPQFSPQHAWVSLNPSALGQCPTTPIT